MRVYPQMGDITVIADKDFRDFTDRSQLVLDFNADTASACTIAQNIQECRKNIVAGQNTDNLIGIIDNRQTADIMLIHQQCRILQKTVLVNRDNATANPSTQDDPNTAIAGMPVLAVLKAQNVIVFKRSMNTGYAGVQNPLFFKENTHMLFGDAKASVDAILKAL